MFGSTAEPEGGSVDGFLAKRSKAFSLERRAAERYLSTGEEPFEAIVDGAGEDHSPQDLAALVTGQRCCDRLPHEEPFTRLAQLAPCLVKAFARGDSWGRVGRVINLQFDQAPVEPRDEGRA